jgi:hypothetical protein
MHCSGNNFIQAMREQMPDNLLVTTTGSKITSALDEKPEGRPTASWDLSRNSWALRL